MFISQTKEKYDFLKNEMCTYIFIYLFTITYLRSVIIQPKKKLNDEHIFSRK